MTVHLQRIVVRHAFPVVFTRRLFAPRNPALRDALTRGGNTGRRRCLVLLDRGVIKTHPRLPEQIRAYFTAHAEILDLVRTPLALTGGETIKQSASPVRRMVEALRASQPGTEPMVAVRERLRRTRDNREFLTSLNHREQASGSH